MTIIHQFSLTEIFIVVVVDGKNSDTVYDLVIE